MLIVMGQRDAVPDSRDRNQEIIAGCCGREEDSDVRR